MSQPYPYPANIVVLADLLKAKIEQNKDLFTIPVQDVWYGDQDRLPRTPAVCIEPNVKHRELQGVPNMTQNQFEIQLLVYISRVQDTQISRRDADNLAYEIEKLIHQDLQLRNGGDTPNVIHGFVRDSESGFARVQNTLYRAARLTYFGLNKTSLPAN